MKLTPEYIRDTLLKLGFSPANSGFHYIVDAMMVVEENPNAAYNVSKMVYVPLAKTNKCTFNAIERCIRHSVKLAMRVNAKEIVRFLHFQPNGVNGSYKNADFLAAFHMALHRG